MAPSLNVIALISGGKDSLFSLLHVQAHGHRIVALGNLHPTTPKVRDGSVDAPNDENDLDSFMYQTVGHSVIPLYEKALGIPLYRQEITGTAVNSNRDYAYTATSNDKISKSENKDETTSKQEQGEESGHDETEDLTTLLLTILKSHPEANALSTGAILSTYQRTRVESVALRLGLTPLSYLWQYPLLPPYSQTALLHDMAAVGQEALIVKTASGGLDESFLGEDVASRRTVGRLMKAMGRFGEGGNGAVVGEGGEFETLAVDGPGSLWKGRIKVEVGDRVVLDGGQAVARLRDMMVEEKCGKKEEGHLRIPELWDEEFENLLESDELHGTAKTEDEKEERQATKIEPSGGSDYLPRNTSTNTSTLLTISNATSIASTPSDQLSNILEMLDVLLTEVSMSKTSINHCTLLLRTMDDFIVLNPIYGEYFNFVNPPARATIAIGDQLPSKVDVMLSVVAEKSSSYNSEQSVDRQGLHVQSRSYWAPANIGPYSQAVSVMLPSSSEAAMEDPDTDASSSQGSTKIVYVAGQIPLVPASMDMFDTLGFKGQALLSLQHLWRIGRAKNVDWWTSVVGFISEDRKDVESDVQTAQATWRLLHSASKKTSSNEDQDASDEDEDIDPWDRLNTSSIPTFNDTTPRAPIPNPSRVKITQSPPIPPCFIAQISSLPRAAAIEWSATGLSCTGLSSIAIAHKPTPASAPSAPPIHTTTPSGTQTRFLALPIPTPDAFCAILKALKQCIGDKSLGVRVSVSGAVYTTRGLTDAWSGAEGRDLQSVLYGVTYMNMNVRVIVIRCILCGEVLLQSAHACETAFPSLSSIPASSNRSNHETHKPIPSDIHRYFIRSPNALLKSIQSVIVIIFSFIHKR